jgi:hypothetical protein
MMKQLTVEELIFGTKDLTLFAVCVFFALIGMLIMLLKKSSKRNKHSETTPFNFKLSFLLLDNLKEIILSLLLVLMALRFSIEFKGVDLTVWYAFIIGLSSQQLSTWFSKLEATARE